MLQQKQRLNEEEEEKARSKHTGFGILQKRIEVFFATYNFLN